MLFPPRQPKRDDPQRVVVTGAGVVTAHGAGYCRNLQAIFKGIPAFKAVQLFDVSRHRAKRAAVVDLARLNRPARLSANHLSRIERASLLLLAAAGECINESGLDSFAEPIPIILGTTSGGMSLGENYYRTSVESPRARRNQASRVVHYQCQKQALDICDEFQIEGPITIIANACASGSNAIGHAFHQVRSGRTEIALTGGFDGVSELVFSGFDTLQALSTTECRPFDAKRDGLALGEGAAVFAIENLDHATKRGASIIGEIVGYGASTDAHHLTQPHPEGIAALKSMLEATEDAKVNVEEIGYINAHGTGTVLNDISETHAIQSWAGNHVQDLDVSSTKSSIGHTLGAAGAIEAAICIMALNEKLLPPTASCQNPDPAIRFQLLNLPKEKKTEYILSNSFGFGGANATLIFKKFNG
ncbi:MAG: Beta-ketoacyl synthase [Verrucomicrobiales bacterium]|nr:Beta-ketoacyl synthase [Verrucomicrobiales bacterium]